MKQTASAKHEITASANASARSEACGVKNANAFGARSNRRLARGFAV
jgi:hypothetical protein